MRITLDTNVLVTAFISKRGQPATVIDMALALPQIEIVLSEPIFEEFTRVFSRKEIKERFDYASEDIEQFLIAIRNASTKTKLRSTFRVIKEDPDDDFVINTAYDGRADYIVSGDRHLKSLGRFKRIRIVTPKVMLGIIRRSFGESIMRDPDNE